MTATRNDPNPGAGPAENLTSVAPTVARLLGLAPPLLARGEPLAPVLRAASDAWSDQGGLEAGVSRSALIYLPDAVGRFLQPRFPDLFRRVRALLPVEIPLRSMVPPKTPVCFASMFTGAAPDLHGIRRYERPVLACDTLFHALAREGCATALVSVRDSSMDLIFRGSGVEHLSGADDAEVTRLALDLLDDGRHRVIVAYHQEYDDALHAEDPFSPAAVGALHRHVQSLEMLTAAAERAWAGRDRFYLCAPDHGAHIDPHTGRGDHGEDIPEDMEVSHFYGFRGARPGPPR